MNRLDCSTIIVNTPQFHVSDEPAETPQLSMQVSGKPIKFLVDTGATTSCLRKKDLSCPLSNLSVQSVGISGVPQREPLSVPLPVDLDDIKLQHSFVVSATTPMSLLGRDLLSKLNAVITCSPDGIEVYIPADKTYQLFSHLVEVSHNATSVLTNCDFIPDLFTLTNIKKLASCQAASAALIIHLRSVNMPFSDEVIEPTDMEEIPQRFFMSPKGLVLLWKNKEGVLHFFICAVRTDFGDMDHLLISCQDYLKRTPDQIDQNKDYIIWSYGPEPTHFFIKLLQTTGKPLISLMDHTEILLQPPSILAAVPSKLWALHANHVGLLNVPPYQAKINPKKYPVFVKQYPLSKEKEDGIRPVIESLLEQGVIVKRRSQNNTPINPILKPGTNRYRFTQDLRKINEAVIPIAPVVPDVNSILTALPAKSKFYTAIDLCSAYFSIPVHVDTQDLFAFTYKNDQYVWTRLPMGFVDSAVVYSAAVNMHLSQLILPCRSCILQYSDDLLLCSETEEECIQDSVALLTHLADGGHRASLAKLQFCQESVNYLGYVLRAGCRYLSPERVAAIMDIQKPRMKTEMLSFLGLVNYCRPWLADYAFFDSVLRRSTLQDAPEAINWTEDMKHAFRHIKYLLCTAPALGLPDYNLDFHLYVSDNGEVTSAVLAQTHGERMRPVAYYSKSLPLIVQGMVPCLRAVAAAAMMVEKAQTIVLGYPLTLHTTHAVNVILLNITTQHMTSQRRSNYEHILTGTQNLTISTATHTNPAIHLKSLLHGDKDIDDVKEHDCMDLINSTSSVRTDLQQTPLNNGELVLYCDGSAMRPDDSTILSGYAIVDDQGHCLESYKLPVSSAQAAELVALTRACLIAKDKSVTIYTDSKYAFSVAHDFSKIWENRGFVTTAGKPIQHANLVKELLAAMMLPDQIAVVKCTGHSKSDKEVALGNNLADKYAKDAALNAPLSPWMVSHFPSLQLSDPPYTMDDLVSLQGQASPYEITRWQKGAVIRTSITYGNVMIKELPSQN
ncbi:Hypothetical predicted protein [Xyrichtys novacula]|uniref:ribonuclease H n=1 Tax=Xyrichtys novacula TaxID=13765 RepID=A0AAV1G3E8_XYRNO|nr:Hypothetical predicted protein [Xyrichtys novacula]